MSAPTRITIEGIHAPVYHVPSTSSTLDLAASLLADTATPTPHLTTIIADHQSAGRGRLGRSWIAPVGQALLATTIPPRCRPPPWDGSSTPAHSACATR